MLYQFSGGAEGSTLGGLDLDTAGNVYSTQSRDGPFGAKAQQDSSLAALSTLKAIPQPVRHLGSPPSR